MKKGLPKSVIRKHNKKRPPSTIEILVAAWLQTDSIPFKKEAKIGRCHVDVLLRPSEGKAIAIEINGCYWHGCTRCYARLSRKMQLKRFKDLKRYQFLKREGYRVVIIWECDMLNKPDEVRDRLRRLVGI